MAAAIGGLSSYLLLASCAVRACRYQKPTAIIPSMELKACVWPSFKKIGLPFCLFKLIFRHFLKLAKGSLHSNPKTSMPFDLRSQGLHVAGY